MNPEQRAAADKVARFLEELEPVDRKKLSRENKRKERWSLSGKPEESQALAEMGVAPLAGEFSDDDKTIEMEKDDIENLSPNFVAGRCNKRTYLQSIMSPKEILKENFHDDINKDRSVGTKRAKVLRENSLSPQSLAQKNSSKLHHHCTQFENDNILSNSTKKKDSLVPLWEKSYSKTVSVKNSNIKTFHKVLNPVIHSVNTMEEECNNIFRESSKVPSSNRLPLSEQIATPDRQEDEISIEYSDEENKNVLVLKSTHVTENTENSSDVVSTPHYEDVNETLNTFCSLTNDVNTTLYETKNMYAPNAETSQLHSNKCDENVCPLSTVDQAILDFAEDHLDETMVHDRDDANEVYFHLSEEKECFTLQDQSFCSGEKSSTNVQCVPLDSKRVDEDTDSMFSKLSDEVVLSILQWLPKRILVRCMHVCKRWRRLAADGRLWARVDLGGRVLPSGALQTLMERHPLVLRLANATLTYPVLTSHNASEWRVQFLDLSCSTLSPQCVTTVLANCPQLIKLSIEALSLDKDAHKALAGLVNLRTLNASQVTGFNMDCCKSLAVLHKLEHLNVAWTRLDTDALSVLVTSLNSGILRLNIAGCRKTIVDKYVVMLAKRLPNLVELDLSDAAQITSVSAKALTQLKYLEHLALSRCYYLQLKDYSLLNQCHSLRYVDAFGILAPLTVSQLQTNLPKIQFNKFMHSSVARPTVGNRRTSIWGLRTRD